MPLACMGFAQGSRSCTKFTVSCGTSRFTGTWYSARSLFTRWPSRLSNISSSVSAMPMPKVMPPRHWERAVLAFRIRPAAKLPCIRRTRVSPVTLFTPTSAKKAPKVAWRRSVWVSPFLIVPLTVSGPSFVNSGRSARRLLAVATPSCRVRSRSSTPIASAIFLRRASQATKTDPPEDAAPQLPPDPAALGRLLSPKRTVTRSEGTPSISPAIWVRIA